MREMQVVSWCDQCADSDPNARVEASTQLVTLNGKECEIEICLDHFTTTILPLQRLLEQHGREVIRKVKKVKGVTVPVPTQLRAVPADGTFTREAEQMWVCVACGGGPRNKANYAYHLRNVHDIKIPGPTTCPECGEDFETFNRCGQHRATAHGTSIVTDMDAILRAQGDTVQQLPLADDPPVVVAVEAVKAEKVECPSCGVSFPRANLIRHLRTTEKVDIPTTGNTCPDCGENFGSPASVGRHRVWTHKYDAVAYGLRLMNEKMGVSSARQVGKVAVSR